MDLTIFIIVLVYRNEHDTIPNIRMLRDKHTHTCIRTYVPCRSEMTQSAEFDIESGERNVGSGSSSIGSEDTTRGLRGCSDHGGWHGTSFTAYPDMYMTLLLVVLGRTEDA